MPSDHLALVAADLLDRLRLRRPRIHCVISALAEPAAVNMLLALGTTPSLAVSADETAQFAEGADAIIVDIGGLDATRQQAVARGVEAALKKSIPWVLDPVMIDRSSLRAGLAKILLARKPAAMRLSRTELAALAGDGLDGAAVASLARQHQVVIALAGDSDLVFDSSRVASVLNGSPMMAKVAGMGRLASAAVAACLAVEKDPWQATAAALIILGVAGDIAGEAAKGPGSFAVEFIDALYGLDRNEIIARAQVVA
jgi:hydroxyethylthiazole kinase